MKASNRHQALVPKSTARAVLRQLLLHSSNHIHTQQIRISNPAQAPALCIPCTEHTRAPDNVRDLHQAIIDGNTEIVDGQTIGAQQHKISQGVGVPRHITPDGVLDGDLLVLQQVACWHTSVSKDDTHFIICSLQPLCMPTQNCKAG
eukprot:1161066-Pelagomonas_calceolata.AAC.6